MGTLLKGNQYFIIGNAKNKCIREETVIGKGPYIASVIIYKL